MYGLTHNTDGSLLIREPKLIKVGIGLPRGKALNIWMERGKWRAKLGHKKDASEVKTFDTRQQAEQYYYDNKDKAPECNYPRKIGFFTFTRQTADGTLEPDFDAIEAHGDVPTEIDIVFLDDDPFDGAYQMWSQTKLLCKGDGITAERVLDMARGEHEQALAMAAAKDGQRFFPIINGCWTCGCPYAKEFESNGQVQPSPCKPGGDLKFQLLKSIKVGGTAYFHTTGRRSIQNLFSGLYRIKSLTGGRLAGVPLKMTLRPYKTNHNGQTATQYQVSIEFRADTIQALQKNLIEQALKFRSVSELYAPKASVRLIEASPEDSGVEIDEESMARAMTDEFYSAGVNEEDEPDSAETEPAKGTEAVKARLRKKAIAASKDPSHQPAQQTTEQAQQ
jgi:hypothetical protein